MEQRVATTDQRTPWNKGNIDELACKPGKSLDLIVGRAVFQNHPAPSRNPSSARRRTKGVVRNELRRDLGLRIPALTVRFCADAAHDRIAPSTLRTKTRLWELIRRVAIPSPTAIYAD
jgi:hypothetical protein